MERERKSNGPPQHTTFTETLSLIRAVKKRPVLWDRSHHLHNDRRIKDALWEEIASYLGKSVEQVKLRWTSLKDTFRKKLHQEPMLKRVSTKIWPYYMHMCFYRGQIMVSSTRPFPSTSKAELVQLSSDSEAEDSRVDDDCILVEDSRVRKDCERREGAGEADDCIMIEESRVEKDCRKAEGSKGIENCTIVETSKVKRDSVRVGGTGEAEDCLLVEESGVTKDNIRAEGSREAKGSMKALQSQAEGFIIEEDDLLVEETTHDAFLYEFGHMEKPLSPASPQPMANPPSPTKPQPPAEPVPTADPQTTANPQPTANLQTTANPQPTDDPQPTANPQTTANPQPTTNLQTTANPQPTANPQATTNLQTTANPQPTVNPEPPANSQPTASNDDVKLLMGIDPDVGLLASCLPLLKMIPLSNKSRFMEELYSLIHAYSS